MCTKYWFYSVKLAQEKSVARQTDHPDMAIAVDWDIKHETKQKLFCLNYMGFFFPVNPIEQFHHNYGSILWMNNSKNPDWLASLEAS